MTNPMIKIHDIETGTDIERSMNAQEFAQYKIDQATSAEQIAERENKASAKVALLERLGITAEEASLLLS